MSVKSQRIDSHSNNKNTKNCSIILKTRLPEMNKKLTAVQFDIDELHKKYQKIKQERLEIEKNQQILVNRVKYLLEEKKRSKIFNSKNKHNEKIESVEKIKPKIIVKIIPNSHKRNRSNNLPTKFNSVEQKNSLSHKRLINDQPNENSNLNLTETDTYKNNKNNKDNNIYVTTNNKNKINAYYNSLWHLNLMTNNSNKLIKNENTKIKKNQFSFTSNYNLAKRSTNQSQNINSTNSDTNSNSKHLDPHNNITVRKFALYKPGTYLNKSYDKVKENTCIKKSRSENSKSIQKKSKINLACFNNENSSSKKKIYKKILNNYSISDIKINDPSVEKNSSLSNKLKNIDNKNNNLYQKKETTESNVISILKTNLTNNNINSTSNFINNFRKQNNKNKRNNYIKKFKIKTYSKENNKNINSKTFDTNTTKPTKPRLNKNYSYCINIENKKRELGIINYRLEKPEKNDNFNIKKIEKNQEKIINNRYNLSNSSRNNKNITGGLSLIKVKKCKGAGITNLNFKRKNDTKITFKDINNYLSNNCNFTFNPISMFRSFELKTEINNKSLSNEKNSMDLQTKKK